MIYFRVRDKKFNLRAPSFPQRMIGIIKINTPRQMRAHPIQVALGKPDGRQSLQRIFRNKRHEKNRELVGIIRNLLKIDMQVRSPVDNPKSKLCQALSDFAESFARLKNKSDRSFPGLFGIVQNAGKNLLILGLILHRLRKHNARQLTLDIGRSCRLLDAIISRLDGFSPGLLQVRKIFG